MSHTNEIEPDRLILVVVGAHLRAELHDRHHAGVLRDWIADRLLAGAPDRVPVLCTDLWYLNDNRLVHCPTISVGGPSVNALSAHLVERLPKVFVIDDLLSLQLDLDGGDQRACVWGRDASATASAIAAFEERYLDAFLDAVVPGFGGPAGRR